MFKQGNTFGGRKKGRPNITSVVKKAIDDDDLLFIKGTLLDMCEEYLGSDDEDLRWRSWKELMKYCFTPKKQPEGVAQNNNATFIEQLIIEKQGTVRKLETTNQPVGNPIEFREVKRIEVGEEEED